RKRHPRSRLLARLGRRRRGRRSGRVGHAHRGPAGLSAFAGGHDPVPPRRWWAGVVDHHDEHRVRSGPLRGGHPSLSQAADGAAGVELFESDAAGSGVSLSWDPQALPWVQIFTADVPDHPELDRRAVAVEAMTCPPDAFNSGTDLLVLGPGETHEATWTIAA